MPNAKIIDEKTVNAHIEFLTDSAVLSRSRKINPRNSYCAEFLEKVKVVIEKSTSDVDKPKDADYNAKSKKAEYERYE